MAREPNGRRGAPRLAKLRREIAAAKNAVAAAARNTNSAARRTGRRAPQSNNYTRAWQQGVGAAPRNPFPRGRSRALRRGRRGAHNYFNALSPLHLALPRAIGGYSVVKTSGIVKTSGRVILLGTMSTADESAQENMCWSNFVGVQSVDSTVAMNGAANASSIPMTTLGTSVAGWEHCHLAPAAITVQIMYPTSVQRAGGIAYIGRLKTLPELSDNTRTWDTFADQFVSYNTPRLCAGGKLALRGVQVSAIPYDMTDLSDFTQLRELSAGTFTWSNTRAQDFRGFAPIVIVNDLTVEGEFGMELHAPMDLLVTVEWRVRFDPSNPAQAGHILRKPASEGAWAHAVKAASDMGHGVMDIVEAVATAGEEAGEYAWEGM